MAAANLRGLVNIAAPRISQKLRPLETSNITASTGGAVSYFAFVGIPKYESTAFSFASVRSLSVSSLCLSQNR